MNNKKSYKADLTKNLRGYFLIGLAFALFVSWRAIEFKSGYTIDISKDNTNYEDQMGEIVEIDPEMPEPPPPPEEEVPPPPPPPPTEEIEVVEDDESQDMKGLIDDDIKQEARKASPPPPPPKAKPKKVEKKKAVDFRKIESKPIYPGCEKESNAKQLDCFSKKLDKLLVRYADDIAEANEEGLTGMVIMQLKINEDGSVQNSVLRGVHKDLDGAIQKILKKIPKVQPGKQRNEPVTVTLTKPIRISG